MDYQAEIINIIQNITDQRVLAFLYGLVDELVVNDISEILEKRARDREAA